jgi:hypothetical protein
LIAFGLAGGIWRAALDISLLNSILIAVAYSMVFSSIAAFTGVQKIAWSSASAGGALEFVPSTVLALLVTLAANFWLSFLPTPWFLWPRHWHSLGMFLRATTAAS